MNTLCLHSLKVGVVIKEMGDACNVSGMKQNLLEISVCSEWVVLLPARHIEGHFGDKSFQAIMWTGTD